MSSHGGRPFVSPMLSAIAEVRASAVSSAGSGEGGEATGSLLDQSFNVNDTDSLHAITKALTATVSPLFSRSKPLDSKGLVELGARGTWCVSSAKPSNGVRQLRDGNLHTVWQSDGCGPHTVTINFPRRTKLCRIELFIDQSIDESYTPSLVAVRSGTTQGDLESICEVKFEEPRGWQSIELSSLPHQPLHEDDSRKAAPSSTDAAWRESSSEAMSGMLPTTALTTDLTHKIDQRLIEAANSALFNWKSDKVTAADAATGSSQLGMQTAANGADDPAYGGQEMELSQSGCSSRGAQCGGGRSNEAVPTPVQAGGRGVGVHAPQGRPEMGGGTETAAFEEETIFYPYPFSEADVDNSGSDGQRLTAEKLRTHGTCDTTKYVSAFCFQIAVLQNYQLGQDCHIRQMRLLGPPQP